MARLPSADSLSASVLEVLPPAMRVVRQEMRGIAQPELTIAQFRILTRLDVKAHTNKQLADWMGIAAATMCRTVDVLVKRGLVARETGANDRREVSLALTAKGKAKYSSIQQSTRRMLKQRLSVLSEREMAELETGLAHLARAFLK